MDGPWQRLARMDAAADSFELKKHFASDKYLLFRIKAVYPDGETLSNIVTLMK